MTFAAGSSWNSGAAASPPPAEAWLIDYDLAISNTVNVDFVGATATTIEWGDGDNNATAANGGIGGAGWVGIKFYKLT